MKIANKKVIIYAILLLVGFLGGFFTHTLTFPTQKETIPNPYKALPSSQQKLPKEWQTYTNSRFGFTINYPKEWIAGREADNGDGKPLHKDEMNEILVYGTLQPSNFSTQDAPVEREVFILNDGRKATKLKLKDEDGKIRSIVFFDDNGKQYVFFARVSEDFFRENEQLLQEVAKSFKRIKGSEDK